MSKVKVDVIPKVLNKLTFSLSSYYNKTGYYGRYFSTCWFIQQILTPTFSFFLLSFFLSESFFLKLCFQQVTPVTNVIRGYVCASVLGCVRVWASVRRCGKCVQVCVCVQECVWVNTGVCRYAGKRMSAQVSVWVYMSVYGMNFQNTYWRLDS